MGGCSDHHRDDLNPVYDPVSLRASDLIDKYQEIRDKHKVDRDACDSRGNLQNNLVPKYPSAGDVNLPSIQWPPDSQRQQGNIPSEPMKQMDDKKLWVTSTGASRSEKAPGYSMIPRGPMIRIARRYDLGAEKHGRDNYLKGIHDPVFLQACYDHMFHHMLEYANFGNVKDDNLAAIAWNAITLMRSEEENDVFYGFPPECQPKFQPYT